MFEIFKTNVKKTAHATALIVVLQHYLPFAEISFDLDDCDSVLRIKGGKFCPLTIIQILADLGFECHVLA
jgi:hypothetical protein